MRSMTRSPLLPLSVVVCLLALPAFAARDAETTARWRDDLAYFKTEAPRRHASLFHNLPRERFESMVDDLTGRIGELQDYEIVAGIGRIVAALGPRDGHSRVNFFAPAIAFHPLPLNFYDYADGIHIRAAAKPYADLAGMKLVAIGGTPTKQAFDAVLAMTPGDNAMSQRSFGAELLSLSEILRALKIAGGAPADPVELTVAAADGLTRRVSVIPVAKLDGLEWSDVRDAHPPLFRRWATKDPFGRHEAQKNFWYDYQLDSGLLYVNLTVIQDAKDETIAHFFDRVFDFADHNTVRKFVLDIRNNSGGNNYLNRPILYGLIRRASTIAKSGTFFVVIGRETFSAAQNLANVVALHTDAIFVGEPTGGAPNHFGDSLPLTLPNSKLSLRLSSVWWQDFDPRDQRLSIGPDVAAPPRSSDDRSGDDPALAAIRAYTPSQSLTEVVRAALGNGGKAKAVEAVAAWKAMPQHAYATGLEELNRLAASLYGEKRESDAVIVFELNALTNPDAWLAHNSLGRAYSAAGKKDLALAEFRRALEIRPNAPETLSAIDRLNP